MSHDVNLLDRLRIERAVWSVDQRLAELPRKTRIDRRRELRANLLEAAHDVGAATALEDVGDRAALAAEFIDAELGSGPRASWKAAGIWMGTATAVMITALMAAANAFGDGILAGDPGADGTYTWSGIAYLQSSVTYTVEDGDRTFVGGAFTPLTWFLLLGGMVLIGRLWRAMPWWRRS